MSKKSISIIIPTYNGESCIVSCLNSIKDQGFTDYEIIVVDNASNDKSADIIKNSFPEIKLIRNQENYGPCKARNQGISIAEGSFILCLDHDTRLGKGCLKALYETLINNDKLGSVGPKILLDDEATIYSLGIKKTFLRRFYDIGAKGRDSSKDKGVIPVFGASVACALYRRDALEAIKQGREYFDEDFFYFFEDADVSWRLQKKGYGAMAMPQAICFHKAGRSRLKDKYSQYLCLRNRYFTLLKNESIFGILYFPFVFILYDFWRNVAMLVSNPKYFIKGIFETCIMARTMINKKHK